VKTDSTPSNPKRKMGTMVKTAIVAVVIVGVLVGFAETNGFYTGAVTKYFYTTSLPQAATRVTVMAIDTSGHLTNNATYKVGDTFDLSITEVSSANPIAVHEVFNNTVYLDHAWNVTVTGHTYILSDVAHANDVGNNLPDYVVVAFDNNNDAISNTITITITP
jgi:hypothetical protein